MHNSGNLYDKDGVNNAILYDSFYWLNKCNDGYYHYLRLCNLDICEKGYIDIPTCLSVNSTLEEKIDYMTKEMLRFIKDINIYFVKFEDLKLKLKETMQSLCNILNIEFDPILLETTANGIKIYESTSYTSNDIRTGPIDQKDMSSMQNVDYLK